MVLHSVYGLLYTADRIIVVAVLSKMLVKRVYIVVKLLGYFDSS